MLLAPENYDVRLPGLDNVGRGKWRVAAPLACLLGGCYPGDDHEAYDLALKCEVLSRGEGLVRTQMEGHHAKRLPGFNEGSKLNLDHYAGTIGKRANEVRKESEAYLQKAKSALANKDDTVIRDAVNAIELCISIRYD